MKSIVGVASGAQCIVDSTVCHCRFRTASLENYLRIQAKVAVAFCEDKMYSFAIVTAPFTDPVVLKKLELVGL